jgi:hypothetical protein
VRNLILILVIACALTGGAVTAMSTPAHAQYGYSYSPPPADPYSHPWVGPNTPWVYYNGDWFLNGLLYYFFGPQYGWAPYYAYPPIYIVRPHTWYEPKWHVWYERNPRYYTNFKRAYPYWVGHREGQRYNLNFYEQHHHGQGGGWQKGFRGVPPKETQPEKRGPGRVEVAPQQELKQTPGQQQRLREQQQREQRLQQQQQWRQREQKQPQQLEQRQPQVQPQPQPQPQLKVQPQPQPQRQQQQMQPRVQPQPQPQPQRQQQQQQEKKGPPPPSQP